MAEEQKDFPNLTLNDYDKKLIIPGCLIIFSFPYYHEIYSFFIDIIKSYIYIEDHDLQGNIITILMSIFSSLFTFISIIFLYYNFTNKASSEKLAELLLKIEEFCYTYRNIEFKKQHKTFKEPSNISQYKSPISIIKSYYGQYNLELKKHNNNQLFYNKLIGINYIVSFVAILIILYSLCVINFLSLPMFFFIFIVSVLLIFNSYIAKETTNFNEELEKFPTPTILLTPTETLDEYCTTNFCIDRNLPLKLFHTCTTLNVCPFSEISSIISKTNYLYNQTNYLIINSIFPFNIHSISLYYPVEEKSLSCNLETFTINSIKSPDDDYKYYLITAFPIKNPFSEYENNKLKLQLDIELICKNSQKAYLTYEYSNIRSQNNHSKFLPITDVAIVSSKKIAIKENDISIN